MDPETAKLIGSAGAQLILAVGYIPAWKLISMLWADRKELSDRLLKVTIDSIEAEKDMTQALTLLAGKCVAK